MATPHPSRSNVVYSGTAYLKVDKSNGTFSWKDQHRLRQLDKTKTLLERVYYDVHYCATYFEGEGLPSGLLYCKVDSSGFDGKTGECWVTFLFEIDETTKAPDYFAECGDVMAVVTLEEEKRTTFKNTSPTTIQKLPGMKNEFKSTLRFPANDEVLTNLDKSKPFVNLRLIKLKRDEDRQKDLASKDDFPDFSILSGATSKVFKCHKFQLAKNSPVFEAMFNHSFKEAETNQVQIEEFGDKTIEDFVNFIYAGELDDSCYSCELMYMANKYQVTALALLCDIKLAKVVAKETVAEMWVASVACSASRLLDAAHLVILDNWEDRQNLPGIEDLLKTKLEFMTGLADFAVKERGKEAKEIWRSHNERKKKNCECADKHVKIDPCKRRT